MRLPTQNEFEMLKLMCRTVQPSWGWQLQKEMNMNINAVYSMLERLVEKGLAYRMESTGIRKKYLPTNFGRSLVSFMKEAERNAGQS